MNGTSDTFDVNKLKSWKGDVNKGLLDSCKRGNPMALKLYFEMTDQLKKKDEGIELSADEYFEVLRQGEIRAQAYFDSIRKSSGDGSVQGDSPILPGEVCVDSDAVEAAEAGEVATLEVSGQPAG